MAPDTYNQPALDSASAMISDLLDDILSAGILRERIYFLGFSPEYVFNFHTLAILPVVTVALWLLPVN